MGAVALKGTVDRRVYANDSTGFAILTVRPAAETGIKGLVSIKGKNLASFKPGQGIDAKGRWVKDAKYGQQFIANSADETVPTDVSGISKWLYEVGIPGVGPATANKLAQAFGKDTIARIAEGHEEARRILGPKFEDAQKMMVQRHAETVMGPMLAEHGIGKATRAKIFEKYGMKTAGILQKDPYRLIKDIEGIAFTTADAIAHAIGIASMDKSRIQAAAIDSLRFAAADGHTAVTHQTLAEMVKKRTELEDHQIASVIEDIDHDAAIATTVVIEDEIHDAWALSSIDHAEQMFAEAVISKIRGESRLTLEQAEYFANYAVEIINKNKKPEDHVKPNKEQAAAVIMALTNNFSIITGGPGTGKTFVLNIVTKAWKLAARAGLVNPKINLGAPTGKAAQRMKESTGISSMTLHRILEADGEGFNRNEKNPIEDGLIAVDETSMKDIWLASAFAKAWGNNPVLLIGDPDQLASVGPGRVLGDLIDSGVVPVTRLVEIKRQAKGSAIAEGAQSIREGKMPVMSTDDSSDLMFFEMEGENATEEAAETAKMLHDAYVRAGKDVQLLTPGHKAETGTVAMNEALQEAANLEGQHVEIGGGCVARIGDRVIQIENDKDLQVYNGDTGVVIAINAGVATIRFGDRDVDMDEKALQNLGLSYALTVHKAQGSEYEIVIMVMTTAHYSLLRRTLFYTGLTRAKVKCIIIGTKRALEIAIKNDDGRARITTLASRLRAMVD